VTQEVIRSDDARELAEVLSEIVDAAAVEEAAHSGDGYRLSADTAARSVVEAIIGLDSRMLGVLTRVMVESVTGAARRAGLASGQLDVSIGPGRGLTGGEQPVVGAAPGHLHAVTDAELARLVERARAGLDDGVMTLGETAYHQWAMAQSGIPSVGCDCGHDGMGVDWHTGGCRGSANAARRQVLVLFEVLAEVGRAVGMADPVPTGTVDIADEVAATLNAYQQRMVEAEVTTAGLRLPPVHVLADAYARYWSHDEVTDQCHRAAWRALHLVDQVQQAERARLAAQQAARQGRG
jgi:hypothetical protein